MLGVAAMATQNGLVRLALPGAPSTAVMTTNVTQLTVDLATLVRRHDEWDELPRVRRRTDLTAVSVLGFAIGLALGAVFEIRFGLWSLIFPVILAALSIPLGEAWTGSSDKASHSAHA
jgi:Predicted membrane protein